jgi:hypothetical protein
VVFCCLLGHSYPNLQELNIWLKVTERDFEYLNSLHNLKTMSLVLSGEVKKDTTARFMSTHCLSLTHLALVFQNFSSFKHGFSFGCRMQSLKSLKLVGYKGSLDFLQGIPKLEILDVSQSQYNHIISAWLQKDWNHAGLRSIKLKDMGHAIDSFKGIDSLHILPRIVSLEIDNCNNELLELVYKTMPLLMVSCYSHCYSINHKGFIYYVFSALL